MISTTRCRRGRNCTPGKDRIYKEIRILNSNAIQLFNNLFDNPFGQRNYTKGQNLYEQNRLNKLNLLANPKCNSNSRENKSVSGSDLLHFEAAPIKII